MQATVCGKVKEVSLYPAFDSLLNVRQNCIMLHYCKYEFDSFSNNFNGIGLGIIFVGHTEKSL
jgi:hypothetical protein